MTVKELGSDEAKSKSGYKKIQRTCEQADKDGLDYAWVDTCCIDKTGSAELSEAINLMFRWYKDAKICYACLEDVEYESRIDDPIYKPSLYGAKWFTRGWALQELVAPTSVVFYSKD